MNETENNIHSIRGKSIFTLMLRKTLLDSMYKDLIGTTSPDKKKVLIGLFPLKIITVHKKKMIL